MNIPRYCSECRHSLLTTATWVSIPKGLQGTYTEYLNIYNQHGKKTLIVQIVDVDNQCNHGFHLWCLLCHYQNCKTKHNHIKICCPVENCTASFASLSSLSVIPLVEYRKQYMRANTTWKLKNEYFVVNSVRHLKRF